MKSERKPPPKFHPVTLILESQAEVDAVFAFLNHNELCKTADLPGGGEEFMALLPYKNDSHCAALHAAICRLMK